MIESVVWRISLYMARIGGGMLIATAVLVSCEVVLRKTGIFMFSIGSELSSYALAVGATWSFALVLLMRGHVRIDIVSQRLPDRPRQMLNVLAVASLAVVALILSVNALETALTSLSLGARSNTTLGVPMFVPQALWTFGLAWFAVVAFFRTVVLSAAFLRGDLDMIERLAAPATADAEAEDAAREAQERLAGSGVR